MSYLTLAESAAPSTPSAAKGVIYVDNTPNPMPRFIDDGANNRPIVPVNNFSSTAQSVATTARTYITGSNIAVPTSKLQIGSRFRWMMNLTKTAAGSASSVFDIAVGTAGTTADTARVSFTKPAGTAAADEGTIWVDCICRGPLSASGVFAGQFTMVHNLSATGHATIPCVCVNTVSAGFDVTVASLIVGLCITAGASDSLTIQMCAVETWNL